MDFRAATESLGLTAAEIADEIGVSVWSVRQARLDPASPNYRPPRPGWQKALSGIAKRQSERFSQLAEELSECR